MKQQEDLLFWLWLSEALGAENSDFRRIIEAYESPYEVYEVDADELERRADLKEKTILSLSDKSLQRASEILDACQRQGIGVMPYDSALYPQSLREIKNPPVLLYYVGTVPRFQELLCVGLVGTRRMSEYGMEMAYRISYELASGNAVTVSGLAEGIDGVCAAATMRAGGTTVAVLGCGLDRAYPAHHGKLMNEVAVRGLLLSEYPPGTKPLYYHFPSRNRIISGLSHAVVVVEAGLGSGSLITAKDAVMQGKDVFAVPSNVGGKGAEGVNGLLRDGAFFAAGAEDIARKYEYLFPSTFRIDLMKRGAARSAPDTKYLREIGVWKGSGEADANEEKSAERDPKPVSVTHASRSKTKSEPSASRSKEPNRRSDQNEKGKAISDALLQSLTPVQLDVLKAIPDDQTVSADALVKLEHPYGEILTALTMLEIMGLLEKLPGAVYRKA
jgi:DNA processing protein